MNDATVLTLSIGIVFAFICGKMGEAKNRLAFGVFIGLIAGPLGCLIMLFMPPREGKAEGVGSVLGFCALGVVAYPVAGLVILLGVALWQSIPSWHDYRADHLRKLAAESEPLPTPEPTPAPLTPSPRFAARPTPDPATVRAEIERKYGAPGNR